MKNTNCAGMYSTCKGSKGGYRADKHVIFIDYDTKNLTSIEFELRFLQATFYLGDFYVLETSKGYHAICCSKVSLSEYIRILDVTSCDFRFKEIVKVRGSGVLRISHKRKASRPVYAGAIRSNYTRRQQSKAHLVFMKKYYSASIRYKNVDYTKMLPVCVYTTKA